jgi:hypothetical protein
MEEIKKNGRNRQYRRNRKAYAPEAHKVETRVVGNDAKKAQGISFVLGFQPAHDSARSLNITSSIMG